MNAKPAHSAGSLSYVLDSAHLWHESRILRFCFSTGSNYCKALLDKRDAPDVQYESWKHIEKPRFGKKRSCSISKILSKILR